jgi:hypothetical protein
VQIGQRRQGFFAAQPLAFCCTEALAFGFNRIEHRDAVQGFLRDRALTGLEQVEAFPPRMRPTRQFNTRFDQALMLGMRTGCRKQGFIAGVVIDQPMALPIA